MKKYSFLLGPSVLLALVVAACGDSDDAGGATVGGVVNNGPPVNFGTTYEGGEFHLGPVDYEETVWRNACDPGASKYAPAVRAAQGELLAGLWDGIANVSNYCDACIRVTTAKGKTALLRVVTYGATTTNSIDVSPAAYDLLNSGEYPRTMSWQFAKCDDTGKIFYEFQVKASEYWSSLWIRNARVPLAKVEVKSKNHADFVEMKRATDGSLNDAKGFGKGAFTFKLTGIDGSVVTETFDWPSSGIANVTLNGTSNFQ